MIRGGQHGEPCTCRAKHRESNRSGLQAVVPVSGPIPLVISHLENRSAKLSHNVFQCSVHPSCENQGCITLARCQAGIWRLPDETASGALESVSEPRDLMPVKSHLSEFYVS